jgi:hypothetical protein
MRKIEVEVTASRGRLVSGARVVGPKIEEGEDRRWMEERPGVYSRWFVETYLPTDPDSRLGLVQVRHPQGSGMAILPSRDTTVELHREPREWIAVVDADGTPIPNAEIFVWGYDPPAPASWSSTKGLANAEGYLPWWFGPARLPDGSPNDSQSLNTKITVATKGFPFRQAIWRLDKRGRPEIRRLPPAKCKTSTVSDSTVYMPADVAYCAEPGKLLMQLSPVRKNAWH